jgi:hypothetical protein
MMSAKLTSLYGFSERQTGSGFWLTSAAARQVDIAAISHQNEISRIAQWWNTERPEAEENQNQNI